MRVSWGRSMDCLTLSLLLFFLPFLILSSATLSPTFKLRNFKLSKRQHNQVNLCWKIRLFVARKHMKITRHLFTQRGPTHNEFLIGSSTYYYWWIQIFPTNPFLSFFWGGPSLVNPFPIESLFVFHFSLFISIGRLKHFAPNLLYDTQLVSSL